MTGSGEPLAEPREVAAWTEGVACEPGSAKPDPILVADGVRRMFGGLMAVDVDHLEIQRGAITALIGPNGAGKTTLFNLLTGFDKPMSGQWTFDGRSLSGQPAYKVARSGMVRTFQLTKSLGLLSVLDNMKLGANSQQGEKMFFGMVRPIWRNQEREVEATGRGAARAVQLGEDARRVRWLTVRWAAQAARDGSSPHGPAAARDARRADGGREPGTHAIACSNTSRTFATEGMSVVFVEHDMDVVYDVSDWVVVLAEGSYHRRGSARCDRRQPRRHRRVPRTSSRCAEDRSGATAATGGDRSAHRRRGRRRGCLTRPRRSSWSKPTTGRGRCSRRPTSSPATSRR